METCLLGKPERAGPVEVDDIRKDLLGEFTALPVQVCLSVWLTDVTGVDVSDVRLIFVGSQEGALSQSENLQVYLRVRPFTAAECNNGESQVTLTHTKVWFDLKLSFIDDPHSFVISESV